MWVDTVAPPISQTLSILQTLSLFRSYSSISFHPSHPLGNLLQGFLCCTHTTPRLAETHTSFSTQTPTQRIQKGTPPCPQTFTTRFFSLSSSSLRWRCSGYPAHPPPQNCSNRKPVRIRYHPRRVRIRRTDNPERSVSAVRFSFVDLLAYSFSFLILCFLCGRVIYFRQQTPSVSTGTPDPATPVWVGNLASPDTTGTVARSKRSASGAPGGGHLPSHTQPFADSIDRDFYQTIIRKNLFAPLGTVFSADPDPGGHLTLVGTFLAEDPSASSVLVKNATTGRHHLLSVG